MSNTPERTSRLCIHTHGTGVNWKSIEAIEDLPFADLTDESNRQLYQKAPHEFFALYANGTTIVNAHAFRSFFEHAVDFLTLHPGTRLRAAGRFSKSDLEQTRLLAQEHGVAISCDQHPETRLFKAQTAQNRIQAFVPCAGFADDLEAYRSCLAAGYGVRGVQHWTELWKNDIAAPALEIGIRKRDAFYALTRELAKKTARPLNCSELGKSVHIPSVTVHEWVDLLERLCVIEKVSAVDLKPHRRTLDRPKIYWRHPGFALWLSGAMLSPTDDLCRSFFENAVYLCLTDIHPQARILHFQDTNRVTCPLIVDHKDRYQAYYVCANDVERQTALRHHKSLLKTGCFLPHAAIIEFVAMTQPARVTYENVDAIETASRPTEQ